MEPEDIINPPEPPAFIPTEAISASEALMTALERIEAVEARGGHVDIVAVVWNVDHGEDSTMGCFIRGMPYPWMNGAFLRRAASGFDDD